ncbi:nitroreductase family protein [Streptomyces capillispiralis]|uniref:nitroreductase family protein n=1 Tax=Streptomyces capillispiralis TaxID=68182 RepID=UPI0036C3A4D2
MDVITAMLTRRSTHHLTRPAPPDDEFAYLLKIAATAPDHGRLHPWRWILLRDDQAAQLTHLARRLKRATSPTTATPAAASPPAPLVATLVFTPTPHHKVPTWEQLAATSAMTNNLQLLLHTRGFASIWRTGTTLQHPRIRRFHGLAASEHLLGWLHIGTATTAPQPRRTLADTATKISTHSAADASEDLPDATEAASAPPLVDALFPARP